MDDGPPLNDEPSLDDGGHRPHDAGEPGRHRYDLCCRCGCCFCCCRFPTCVDAWKEMVRNVAAPLSSSFGGNGDGSGRQPPFTPCFVLARYPCRCHGTATAGPNPPQPSDAAASATALPDRGDTPAPVCILILSSQFASSRDCND